MQGISSKQPLPHLPHGYSPSLKRPLKKSILSTWERANNEFEHFWLHTNVCLFLIISVYNFFDILRQDLWKCLSQISQCKTRLSSLSQCSPHLPHGWKNLNLYIVVWILEYSDSDMVIRAIRTQKLEISTITTVHGKLQTVFNNDNFWCNYSFRGYFLKILTKSRSVFILCSVFPSPLFT